MYVKQHPLLSRWLELAEVLLTHCTLHQIISAHYFKRYSQCIVSVLNKETQYVFSLVPRLSTCPAQTESWVGPGNEANIAWIQLCLYKVLIYPSSQLWCIALCQRHKDSHAVWIMWISICWYTEKFFLLLSISRPSHHPGFDMIEWEAGLFYHNTVTSASSYVDRGGEGPQVY